MGDRHDYVALEWVKGEIAETLKQARQALEAFVENPQDTTRLRFCLTYVHQVHGTLQMVEFFGAALLAEEMEQLALALAEGRVSNQAEALEVMMQAILQLPNYLDRIQTARRDLPLVLLPLLNDLRAARGEKLLSETSLFSPELGAGQALLPAEQLARRQTAELPQLLRKLRQMQQQALVGVIRNQELPTNLGYMARVFARLESLSQDAPLQELWQIASGLIEGLANGSVSHGASVRTLLRQIDKELKRLVEQGVPGLNQPAPGELVKNLLFYIAKSTASSPRIVALKNRYRLDEALPGNDLVDEERARLAGPDRDAMRSVVTALCEELVRVKDSLDLFVRSDRKNLADLDALYAPLKQIADTLAVLGFGQPRKVIVDQLDVVRALASGQREPSDALLMDVAGALLYVEATLAGMAGPVEGARDEQSQLPTTDVGQIHQVVIKEARNGLEQAKDAIIEFIASQWNHEHLARAPQLLTQVRGGLAMIPLPRAAALLEAARAYIDEQLLARKAVPNWQHLDTLADAITSVEYYLERLAEDHASQGDLILDVAEESLESLGYPIKPQRSILDWDSAEVTDTTPEPLADPLDEIEVLDAQADEPLPTHGSTWASELEQPDAPLASLPEQAVAEQPAEPAEHWDNAWSNTPSHTEPVLEPLDAWPQDAIELPTSDVTLLAEEQAEVLTWDEASIAELQLPEVELPALPETPAVEPSCAASELSIADVMAAPVQAINPPAQDVPPSLLPPPADEEPVDEELLEVFIEEAAEVLETIHTYLPQWRANTDDREALTELRRAFHTLKGSGRMVRALIIGELSWAIENMLNRVLDRSIQAEPAVQQVVADVVALLPALADEFAAKAQRQRDDVDLLAATAHALARGETPPQGPAPDQADEQDAVLVGGLPEVAADNTAQSDTQSAAEAELDPLLLDIFRNEALTHLETLVAFLADCAQELPQPVTDDLQRALHTLKGSAFMAGILPIAEIAAPLEKMVKEFKANLIQLDMSEAELLHAAEQLMQAGLEQLDSHPLAALPGSAELLERIARLHQERLAQASSARDGVASEEQRDPQMIAIFLAEGMDILLDAEDLLRRWREHPSERQELGDLQAELQTLERGAELAELTPIQQLSHALLELYAAVEDGRLAVSERFFAEAEHAHEALIGMMDQVAAGLQVTEQPEVLAALADLLASAFDPATLAQLAEASQGMQVEEVLVDAEPESAAEPAFDEAPPAVVTPAEQPAVAAYGLDELDAEMVEIFLEEAVDILDSAAAALERWLGEPSNATPLSALQRDLHTLKGGARMAEIRPIGDLAHELETLYEGLVDRRYSHCDALADLLQRCHDKLASQLEQLQGGQAIAQADDLLAAIQAYRQVGAAGLPGALPSATLSAEAEAEAEASLPLAVEAQAQAEALEMDLGELPSVDFQLPDLPAVEPAQPASEPLNQEAEFSLPSLSESEWGLQDALPELGHAGLQTGLPDAADVAPLGDSIEMDLAELADAELSLPDLPLPEETAQPAAELSLPNDASMPALSDSEWAIQDSLPQLGAEQLMDEMAPVDAEPEPEPMAAAAMDEQDFELVEIFLEEGFDIIESAGAALQRWMADTDNSLELESLQRDLHTLKGGARMAEISAIGDLAHELEFLYEGLGNGRLRASPALFGLLQDCHDRLEQMLEALRERRALPDGQALIELIQRFRANPDEQLSMPTSVHLQPASEEEPLVEADSDILDIFLEEAEDLLESIEAAIGRMSGGSEDGEALDDLLRLLHTLKGGARLAGQKRLGNISHDLEQHLTEARRQGQPWPESLQVDLQSAYEGLQGELQQLRARLDEQGEPPVPVAEVAAEPLRSQLAQPIVAASSTALAPSQTAKVLPFVQQAREAAQEALARRAPQELVKVPAELLEGLVNLAGETSIFRGRVEQQVSDFSFTLSEMEATIERVRDQLRRLDTETQAQILSRIQAEAERVGYEDFDPLEMDRHSQLQQLSRALFESASDLLDLKETLATKNRDAETLLLQQARVNTELQEGLMRTRMVPFDRLVPRLRRIVRQIAGELGKQVEFHVGNAEGEMDRTVLERIVAPLEHMLRNAVDHGIESQEQRQAAGKPAVGSIRLELGREGGDIVLTLADDGAGIRLDAVRRKAIERGLMDADASLSDQEILQFILEAGFSTAEKVTQISGRGVGMDVVHSEVKQLGGSMSIASQLGQGTTFTIRLPFTVSVNRALMVLSGEDLYAIPLNTIEGIVRVSPYELEAYYAPDAPRFEYAGQAYELKYLGDLLGNGQQPKLVGQSLPLPVVLVRSKEHAMAVQVDSLAGSREIVVKSLGPQFAGVHGISGATILGDGRVVVILDLLATIRALHAHQASLQARTRPQLAPVAEVEQARPTLVMVVDDSVTVRKVTSRLLERNGMNVLTAKDGVDAITQLQEHKPDIMLLDIEMPRMDGFEVATLVRHDAHLKDLPIIMITSRTGEKHRERAMAIGVNEYLGKPYQESQLLETIQQLIKDPRNV